jgi:hypothetical protein
MCEFTALVPRLRRPGSTPPRITSSSPASARTARRGSPLRCHLVDTASRPSDRLNLIKYGSSHARQTERKPQGGPGPFVMLSASGHPKFRTAPPDTRQVVQMTNGTAGLVLLALMSVAYSWCFGSMERLRLSVARRHVSSMLGVCTFAAVVQLPAVLLPVLRVTAGAMTLIALGSGLTVFMTAPWQLVLLWGVMVGLGAGSISLGFVATLGTRWFVKRQGLVTGILSAGVAPVHYCSCRW